VTCDCLLSFLCFRIPFSLPPANHFAPLRLCYFDSRRVCILTYKVPFDYWIVRPFTPYPLQILLRYYDLGWLLTVRCYYGFLRLWDLAG